MFINIPNYPNYLLDTDNWQIFSKKRNRYIGHTDVTNHVSVELCKNGKVQNLRLHRFIYELFIGEIPEGYVVHHIDENPLNNNPSNLIAMPEKDHLRFHHKGKQLSETAKANMSNAHKGKQSPFKGMRNRYSQETLDKMSKSHIGKPHPHKGHEGQTHNHTPHNQIPIEALKDGVVVKQYPSARAAIADGFTPSKICNCCKGVRKHHKGYTFRYKQ